MPIDIIDSLQNRVAFRGLAMIVHLKIGVEDTQNVLPNINLYHTLGDVLKNRTKVQHFTDIKER
jgi:hypothetical protein